MFVLRRKLADRLGSKSVSHQQQRSQYESQLFNVYSSRHEQALESIYLTILEKQLNNHQHLFVKQQRILDTLQQEKQFCQLLEGMIDHRLTLIDQTSEQLKKILHFNRLLIENSKANTATKNEKKKSKIHAEQNMPNLIDKIKSIENEFCKKYFVLLLLLLIVILRLFSHSAVNTFLDYINRQNDDFRPRAANLSQQLNVHLQSKITEWKTLRTSIRD